MRAAFAITLSLVGPLALATPGWPASPPDVAPPSKSQPPSKGQQSQDQLFAQLAQAESRDDAKPIEDKLEALFRASSSPSVELLMNRTDVAVAQGDTAMARKLVDAVTRIAPHYGEGWYTRAMLESQAGDDAAAILSLQKVIVLNPRQFAALRDLAGMLEDYGDKAGALKLYRRAYALDPQLEGVARRLRALTREIKGQDI